jgi:signal transduction histidine kinase
MNSTMQRVSEEARQAMVQHITEITRTLLEGEYVSVLLTGPEKDQLHLVSIAGASKEQEQNWFMAIENLCLHEVLDASTLSYLREGEVVLVARTQPLLQVMSTTNRQKVMIAPLRVHEQFMGMLIFHPKSKKHKYSLLEKKAVAEVVATFVASAIERERLMNERTAVQAHALSLDTADQRMSDFLSLVGHELRTPLTTMKSNIWFATNLLTDALQQVREEEASLRNLVEDVRELLYRVDQLVGVQNRLVTELLDVSRIQVSKLDLQFRPHRLIPLVLQVVERLASTTSTSRLHVVAGDEESVPVLVDEERIEQVLNNYITNALTYSMPDRPVEIHVQAQGQYARVSVHDAGPGLTLEEQEHVWERFYRVPRIVAQASSRGGLGLGLYLCRMIIELHKGQVGVESIVGEGSTFWFTLPLVECSISI